MLDNAIKNAQNAGRNFITGKEAFTLYDTFGFPLDLTELILKETGMTLDREGFDKEMDAQKQRARNAATVETGDWVVIREGEQEFIGYDSISCSAQILRYRQVKHKNRSYYQIILSQTPFYAEMGGQVGDRGTLSSDDEIIEIFDTKKENGIGVHLAEKMPSDPSATFRAAIDENARLAT